MRDSSRKFSIEYSRKVGKNRLELEIKVKDLSSKLTTSSTESENEDCSITYPDINKTPKQIGMVSGLCAM